MAGPPKHGGSAACWAVCPGGDATPSATRLVTSPRPITRDMRMLLLSDPLFRGPCETAPRQTLVVTRYCRQGFPRRLPRHGGGIREGPRAARGDPGRGDGAVRGARLPRHDDR